MQSSEQKVLKFLLNVVHKNLVETVEKSIL